MSTTVEASADARPRRTKKTDSAPRREKSPRGVDTSALKNYLASLDLGVNPTVHINGRSFSTALVTLDLGSPLKPVKITSEQSSEINDHLRKIARDILGRDTNIRVSFDNANGIVWAGV